MIRTMVLVMITALAASAMPPVAELLRKVEDNEKMTSDVKARVVLEQQKVNQGVKNFEIMYYRRDFDDSFLMPMLGPESEKGNGYLRTDENFWMYRRNTRTFQHINADENIAGSDAHGDDFETRKLTEKYAPAKDSSGKEIVAEEMLGQIPVYRFEVKAKVSDVDYPKKIYWVRRDNCLELKQQSFSSSNTLMQTAYFMKYTIVNNRYVPVKQMFIDEFEKGNKTAVEISDISTAKLDNSIFTKAYLENQSK